MALITEDWRIDIFYIVGALVTAFYLFAKHTYSYWDRMNIKTLSNPHYLMGNFKTLFFQKQSFANFLLDTYNTTTEPFIGLYSTFRPIIFIRDPELIRSILVKDFNNFMNRGVHCNEKKDPLSGHLFNLPGQKWRNLRGKLTPTFSSGKLKSMFSTLVECGGSLQNYLEKAAENGDSVEMRDLAARYTTNNIASVAFGIEVDTITDPNNDFRKFGRKVFEPNNLNAIRGLINFTVPKLMDILPISSVDHDVGEFIFSVVKQNIELREKNNVTRKDFFQMLIHLRNNGAVQLDDQWETTIKSDENQKNMTINEMAAQTFVFFVAGYETSATILSFCLLELAKEPGLQKRVQSEIDSVLEKYNGEITYDSISEMKLTGNCIDETLRMYPVVPLLNRTTMNDYRIPGTKNVIEKGIEVFIPVIGLHHDEKFYPEPSKFKPERFSDDSSDKNQAKRPYLPFGDGPRNCIGMRLGKMQSRIGLVMMMQKFNFTLVSAEDHKNAFDFEPKSFVPVPKNGIHLKVIKRSEFN